MTAVKDAGKRLVNVAGHAITTQPRDRMARALVTAGRCG
jgi:hypothetical protein